MSLGVGGRDGGEVVSVSDGEPAEMVSFASVDS